MVRFQRGEPWKKGQSRTLRKDIQKRADRTKNRGEIGKKVKQAETRCLSRGIGTVVEGASVRGTQKGHKLVVRDDNGEGNRQNDLTIQTTSHETS